MKYTKLVNILKDTEDITLCLVRLEDAYRDNNKQEIEIETNNFKYFIGILDSQKHLEAYDALNHIYEELINKYR